MLLSFERPRPDAGPSAGVAHVTPSRTALENCTVATCHPLTISVGGKRVSPIDPLAGSIIKITVKIVRAHGGCLGT